MKMPALLHLTGGTVVTSLSPPRVERADVVVEGDRVRHVSGSAGQGGAYRIDCSGCLIIPGNVCAHQHLYSTLARGMPYGLEPAEDFIQILRRVWWRLDRALDGGSVWFSAQVGGLEALLAGTTTIVDHHASPDWIDESLGQIAGALDQLGARSLLCYEVTDRDGPDRAQAGLEANRQLLKGMGGAALSRGMVGAHASFTLSDETLAACVELAREFVVGIHIHVAEDEADQRDALARFGKRVVHRLADAGALDERSLLAHCIHLEESEIEAINQSGATVVHNARSNMNNRVGHAPVSAFDRLALGTDGIGSDMFAESKAAYWRARESDPSIGPQWVLDRIAESAWFAGRTLGEPLLGRIEPEAPADLVVVEYDPPTPLTGENLAGHWVFGMSARQVRDVVVNGEVVVQGRRPTRVDAAEILGRAREYAEKRLWPRLEEIGEHQFAPRGGS